ncbi:MAG: thioredoxin domain-containing protein, partial [Candidatus Parcubacteria bacterium]|nr:thioredoxin domain-containing protein [Candidatus Parcubacteria bacterium]
MQNNDQKQIVGAILIVGVLIAGAILLKGSKQTAQIAVPANNNLAAAVTLAPVGDGDKTVGNTNAKVTVIVYADFQCPFCGAVSGLAPNSEAIAYLKQQAPNWTPFMPEILNTYVKNGDVQFVYRDYAFLGPESVKSAEAARCAGDQEKFWEYHDYLYSHQNGENKGAF